MKRWLTIKRNMSMLRSYWPMLSSACVRQFSDLILNLVFCSLSSLFFCSASSIIRTNSLIWLQQSNNWFSTSPYSQTHNTYVMKAVGTHDLHSFI